MDPESAKNTLKTVFHIPEKLADKMVPEPDLGIIKALHPKPAAPASNGSKSQNKRVTKPKAAARK
jgi:hypothetical protein